MDSTSQQIWAGRITIMPETVACHDSYVWALKRESAAIAGYMHLFSHNQAGIHFIYNLP